MASPITANDIQYAKAVALGFVRRNGFFGIEREEIESLGTLALCEAAKDWRPDGGSSLRSFAHMRILGLVKNAIRALGQGKRQGLCVPITEARAIAAPTPSPEEIAIARELVGDVRRLPARQAEALLSRLDKESDVELAQRWGVSKQRAGQVARQARKTLSVALNAADREVA